MRKFGLAMLASTPLIFAADTFAGLGAEVVTGVTDTQAQIAPIMGAVLVVTVAIYVYRKIHNTVAKS